METIKEMFLTEIKNRKKAIEWLQNVTESLKDIVYEVYGDMNRSYDFENYAMNIWREEKKDGKINKVYSEIYFRYKDHRGENTTEGEGFYLNKYGQTNDALWWGNNIEDMKGNIFWSCIDQIKEWLPLLEKDIERKVSSRQSIVETLIQK